MKARIEIPFGPLNRAADAVRPPGLALAVRNINFDKANEPVRREGFVRRFERQGDGPVKIVFAFQAVCGKFFRLLHPLEAAFLSVSIPAIVGRGEEFSVDMQAKSPADEAVTKYSPAASTLELASDAGDELSVTEDSESWRSGARSVPVKITGGRGTGMATLDVSANTSPPVLGTASVVVLPGVMEVTTDLVIERGKSFNLVIAVKTTAGGAYEEYVPATVVSFVLTGGDEGDVLDPEETDASGWSAGAKTVACTIDGGEDDVTVTIEVSDGDIADTVQAEVATTAPCYVFSVGTNANETWKWTEWSVVQKTSQADFGMPEGRCARMSDGKYYIPGGLGSGGAVKTHKRYTSTEDAWDSRKDAPAALVAYGLAENGQSYMTRHGGADLWETGTPVDVTTQYSRSTNAWTSGGASGIPRYHFGFADADGGSPLACGGLDNTQAELIDHIKYAYAPKTWSTKENMTGARYAHVYVARGGATTDYLCWALGGYSLGEGAIVDWNDQYDSDEDTWAIKQVMPTALHEHMAVDQAEKILVTGGLGWGSTKETLAYYKALDAWTAEQDMLPTAGVRGEAASST